MPNGWLAKGLREIGIAHGDVVLVHASMKGLGYVDGGADAVIDALLAAVGANGTVLFPTLTGGKTNSPETPPEIELETTPCWTGLLPETARRRSGAIRSVHPTHSVVALGAQPEHWTQGHALGASPCDQSSPYFRLMDEGGKILLLGGVTQNSNTSMHCIEEIAAVPYHLQPSVSNGVVHLTSGEDVIVPNRLHRWQDRYSPLQLIRDFMVVNEPLTAAGAQRVAGIGRSMSTLIDAAAMRDVLLPMLAEDPLFLLDRSSAE